ncbi:AAA family ATPase [Aliarcobacter butzleri]|uniref:ParA family protein n=1 Tax=Aliarcobacter butzleri TaxID=28197 RepID=UPI0021B47B3F|nr:division plane positioning ATPase MipZ [Aliarcobacter butzleri]MCT7566042.1 AAA family ATPase [Aliarcobacter butzleri]MCT7573392.1 AAA family ATPase [Aliarcobacter butzleri]
MNIVIINTKGGASKSTTAYQVASTYFLAKAQDVTLYELDNQNQDSKNFTNSKIKSKQIQVDFSKELNNTIRDLFLNQNSHNKVIDVGGNQTTTEFIEALKQTHMHNMVDLFIIPISGGHQDVANAKATHELVQDFGKKVVFCLSRSRHPNNSPRLQFQYQNFFKNFKNPVYFVLQDSDVIDLSRSFKKSVFELAQDEQEISIINEKLLKAFDEKNNDEIYHYSQILEILEDSKKYKETNIDVAHQVLDEVLNGKK